MGPASSHPPGEQPSDIGSSRRRGRDAPQSSQVHTSIGPVWPLATQELDGSALDTGSVPITCHILDFEYIDTAAEG